LPPSRDASRTRYAGSQSGERYHETRSVGGKSGESSRSLYQHSTLVLELEHDNQLNLWERVGLACEVRCGTVIIVIPALDAICIHSDLGVLGVVSLLTAF
uniref:Secreted protein n=1 Tax=Heligmosomoides polygyrus TaxID=6339 RepID=A0A183GQG5_HELPZ